MSYDFLFGQKPLPYFKLPDSNGREISGWDFRQRCPLVIAVLHDLACKDCINWFEAIDRLGERIRQSGGECLMILPAPIAAIKSSQPRLGNAVKLLADPDHIYRKKLADMQLAEINPVVQIVDRFGDIAEIFQLDASHTFPTSTEILSVLEFVEHQCPE
jgi:peroxiredoxin